MQPIDNNTYMTRCQEFPSGQSEYRARATRIDASGRLLLLLSSGLVVAGGPTIIDTITLASFASFQLLLEICHFGLVAYQIFGR
jgi:hypothetical protein